MNDKNPMKQSDAYQLEKWVHEYGDILYRRAVFLLRDSMMAEDVVQETYIAALQGLQTFRQESSVLTWLTGILKHKVLDQIRKQSKQQNNEEDNVERLHAIAEDFFDQTGHWLMPPRAWEQPENASARQQFRYWLSHCLEKLSPRMARLFVLREILDMDNEEICKELDITTTNVWVMLHRARLNLRQCLELQGFNSDLREER